MQNKGAVKLLAIALALACLYQLSFTWFATKVENKAKLYAGNDLNKEQHYLDSISGEVVYNFLGLYKYTYRDCNERKLNLGLDLKGGMNVVLEVKVQDVIRALSNFSTDSTFNKAIALAEKNQVTSPKEDFVTLFGDAFEKIAPNAKLASIFSTIELKDRVNFNSSNKEVLGVIREEANAAIDNSFNILQTRIDKFGVVQPVIQQLETKGRIEVQLPGVREPERVRRLLQGTANLEFWTTYENSELWNDLVQANQRINEFRSSEKAVADSVKQATDTTAKVIASKKAPAQKGTGKPGELSLLEKIGKDTTKGTQKLKGGAEEFQFLGFGPNSLLHPNYDPQTNQPGTSSEIGTALIRDTAEVGKYLRMNQIRTLFPRDVRFLWTDKPAKAKSELLELHAIKVSTRDGRAPLDGSAIVNARGEYGANKSVAEVSMTMNAEGAKVWAQLTKENIGRCIAIVLDNSVKSSPRVQNEIPNGSSVITGNFTLPEANDLAIILKAGKMPAPARIIQEDIVGPSLGKESIHAGMLSFIIAFIGVLLYMGLYYGRAGAVANIALFTNVFFLFGVFASMGLVLTLPGFAGIVLTLAMAVDGNVIIYERMREEVRAGKGERMVVKDGFWHAYSAIIDGHVTTILTGIVLFLFGSGPVQGFATSLIVGLLLSLFSSIFIARLMFEWMLDKNIHITLGNRFTINAMTKANIDFIGLRKIMYVASGIVITIGIISLFTRGLDPSVDFKGGRTFTVDFGHPVVTSQIRESLTKAFGEAPEVKTIGTESRAKITTKYLIDNKSSKTDSLVDHKLYEGVKSFFVTPVSYDEFISHSNTKKLGELSSQKVDPVISSELIYKAFMAVFFGLIIIFIYIAIRFKNWKYGVGGVVSLFHDTLVVTTMFSLFYGRLPFSLEVDQQFIAALLTIIGYSIMDTVIIYDRIREYKKLFPSRPLEENINSAINHTLGRTINTSGITVVVLVVIFIFGGEILRGFIFALLVGVITGTYSSVFNATPVAYDIIMLTERKKKQK
jgi:SecD/SecF fusion protein